MAQLELANLLAANGAPAKPVAASAGVEGGAAVAPPFSFSQWLQSGSTAAPATADLAGAAPGDAARVIAQPPATPADASAAAAIEASTTEAVALAVALTEGAALTTSAQGTEAVEEPAAETGAGDVRDATDAEFAAELPWLGLPLVMEARAALRPQDGTSVAAGSETETAGVMEADCGRSNPLVESDSTSVRLMGGRTMVVQSSGETGSEAATAVTTAGTIASMFENPQALPSTGLDVALRPLANTVDAAPPPLAEDRDAQQNPSLALAPQSLKSTVETTSEPSDAVLNPPDLGLTPQLPAANEVPAVSGGGEARVVALAPPPGAPNPARTAVLEAPIKLQPTAAPSSVTGAPGPAPVQTVAREPVPAALEKAIAPRWVERVELQTSASASAAAATSQTTDKTKISERWPAARLLANQSLRWSLERAGLAMPAETRNPPAPEGASAPVPAPAPAIAAVSPKLVPTVPADPNPLALMGGLPGSQTLLQVPPEADLSGESIPQAAGTATKISATANRSLASGGQSPTVTVPAVSEGTLPDRVEGRPSEPIPLTASGTPSPARLVAAATARPDASAGGFLPAAPEVLNLHQKHWERTLGQQLHWMVNNQLHEAEIKVNPPDLGPLEVRVSLQHHQANVTFFSHEAAVREALETALPRLRDLLDAQGITLNQAQVADQSLARQQAGAGEQSAYGRRDDSRTPATTPGAEKSAETAEHRPRPHGLKGAVDDYV